MRISCLIFLTLVAAALACSGCSDDPTTPAPGQVLRVPEQYENIQLAITAARAGDTVEIAPGVYTDLFEYTDFLDRTYLVAGVLKNGVAVRGATGHPADVIVDAQGEGWGFWCFEVDSTASLSGFTVRNALWGISGYDASPTIDKCVVENNGIAENNDFSAGTGMYFDKCTSLITDCVFRGNQARGGAGATFSVSSNVRLEGCLFTENTSTGSGGGLVVGNHSQATMVDCLVTDNTAGEAGGGIYCHGDAMTMIGGAITGNTAGLEGGGVGINGALLGIQLEGVLVTENIAPQGPQGNVGQYSGEVVLVCCETDSEGWAGPVIVDNDGCEFR